MCAHVSIAIWRFEADITVAVPDVDVLEKTLPNSCAESTAGDTSPTLNRSLSPNENVW